MRKHLSIIVPVRNQNEFLRPFYYDLLKHIGSYDYEIIWVNNASTDSSLEEIKDLMNNDCSIRCITLKNETSSRAAVISGLDYAKGEFIVVMKGDLQHPSAMIPKMINILEKGTDIINMHPDNSVKASLLKRLVFDFFYNLNPKMNTLPVKDISDFRGFRREVVEDIVFIQKNHFFTEHNL
jgi:glycosyltransferase involved in cell wall biosynthesis